MTKEEYWYWACNIKNVPQNEIRKMIAFFRDPEEIYKASEDELTASGCVSEETARYMILSKNDFKITYKLNKLKRDGISFVYYGSSEYPQQLLCLEDAPLALYVKGRLPDPDFPSVGIVGARNCSGYGKEMALKFSQTLAANSVQIISGMAAGIDSYASRGAMEAGGKTFVILGSGLDVIYPQQNIELYYQIILNGGGVISEYPMGTAPSGWQFPHRNRLISAFSDKLLIIEARKQSGTLSTAAHALYQGKDIYALPGRITDPLSEGCNNLIADGAGILLDPRHILEELFAMPGYTNTFKSYEKKPAAELMKGDAAEVYAVLGYEPKPVDVIASECGMSCEAAANALTELELEGLCSQASKDCYAKE